MPTLAIVGVRKLGRTIALHFARKGWRVIGVARTQADLDALAKEVNAAGGEGASVQADLTVRASLEPLSREPVDLCVASQSAGGRFGSKPLLEIDDEELARAFAVYVQGAWNLLKAVGGPMAARGTGTFVQIGTSSGVRTKEGFAALGASQHALRALIEVAAKELRASGVHVAYVPVDGPIESEATKGRAAASGGKLALISPGEIARGVDYLAAQERTAWTHELVLRPNTGDWSAPT